MLPELLLALVCAMPIAAQTIHLDPANLRISNVKAEKADWKGVGSIRLTDAGAQTLDDGARFAIVNGTGFQDGVIEVELTGDTKPGMGPIYRGFTGIAFRAEADGSKYECVYLRPKNGRSEDQEQRNHSVQYISFPGFPWQKLRSETPSKYESYVDLVPGEWTRLKIEVRGEKARVYVNAAAQPALLVNDLKHAVSKGMIALWIGPGTVAHFTNLKVTP